MKKSIIIIFSLFLFGCTKQLDLIPQGQLTESNVFTQAGDFLLAIDAAYEPLTHRWRGSWDWDAGAAISRDWVIGDVMSDDAVKGGGGLGDQEDMRRMQTYAIFPTNNNVLGIWRYNYKGIEAANIVLQQNGAKAPDLDAATLKRIKGEAAFLRAFYYFRLVVNFGAVPLLIPEKGMNDNTKRNTVEEIYAQIDEDLNTAATALPASYAATDYQRATSGAAHALWAKTYLYRKYWEKCLDEIALTEGAGGYALLANYADNFNGSGEQGKEIIFASRHDAGKTPSQGSILNAVFAPRGVGWGFNLPTQDLVNEFEAGDPRIKATLFKAGDTYFDGRPFDPAASLTGYCVRKFLGSFNPIDDGGIDYIYIRYADLLLWKAEAYLQLNDLTNAKTALEKVRARARANAAPGALPPITTSDKNDLLTAIRHERRVELAFEGHRYYDLVRWGLAATVLAKSTSADPLTGFKDYGEGWQSKNALLPIPQREADLLGLSQNTGF
jgi:starch-binding outer membrane protein, SusD/RagB family